MNIKMWRMFKGVRLISVPDHHFRIEKSTSAIKYTDLNNDTV